MIKFFQNKSKVQTSEQTLVGFFVFYISCAYFFVAILGPLRCNLKGIMSNHRKMFTEQKHAKSRVGETLGKGVYVYSGTWVRISLSPH